MTESDYSWRLVNVFKREAEEGINQHYVVIYPQDDKGVFLERYQTESKAKLAHKLSQIPHGEIRWAGFNELEVRVMQETIQKIKEDEN